MMFNLPSFVILAIASSSAAFSIVSPKVKASLPVTSSSSSKNSNSIVNHPYHPTDSRFNFLLHAAAEESTSSESNENVEQVESEVVSEEEEEGQENQEEEEESNKQEDSSSSTTDDNEAEEEEPEEDPEITAMKKEINELESLLKQKNRDLNNMERMVEEYTKGGYARKVAEMESFRRRQSMLSTDNKMAARAHVLQSFLPILEKLQENNARYEGDEFAKSYGALCWDFNNALKDLGVVEYTVKEGDVVDVDRVAAVKEEHSDTFAKGTVIQPVDIGFEIEGNVMKAASAVVSLGPEVADDGEEGEGEKDGDDNDQAAENEGEAEQ